MDHRNQTSSEKETLQDVVLQDINDFSAQQKSLKNARIWLYVIAGFQFAMGIYEYVQYEGDLGIYAFAIDAIIALIYLGLALLSYKKPSLSFLLAVISYIAIYVVFGILDPGNFMKGILIKILVVVALVRAYNQAKEIDTLKKEMGAQ